MVRGTRQALPEALIVLVGPYWNLQYDAGAWEDPDRRRDFGKFGLPGDDLVLVIPDDYARLFSTGRPAEVQLIVDDSRQGAGVHVSRTRSLLRSYSSQVSALRLIARGVSPAVTRPMKVQTVDVATPQSQAASFLGLMPYFLIFSVFIGNYTSVIRHELINIYSVYFIRFICTTRG